jgi:hypothetical protein
MTPFQPGIRHVFHLAEADNWPSIEKHGLLSAAALLTLPHRTEADRLRVTQHRTERTVLSDGCVVRDQLPMPPSALRRCLHGMTPEEWYALLNGKVFFWVDPQRLERHIRACRRHPQIVMVLDVARLLECHGACAAVSRFNTGNARRRPATRGRGTFVPYASWLETGWQHEADALQTRLRARGHPPAELVVDGSVPDALSFVVETRRIG